MQVTADRRIKHGDSHGTEMLGRRLGPALCAFRISYCAGKCGYLCMILVTEVINNLWSCI